MNRAEKAYAERLATRHFAGEILRSEFEPERLRLSHSSIKGGQSAWYTPDFRVILPDGTIEFHEVKGRWEEAAKVRIRVAADQHPYRFVVVRVLGGVRAGWQFETSDVE